MRRIRPVNDPITQRKRVLAELCMSYLRVIYRTRARRPKEVFKCPRSVTLWSGNKYKQICSGASQIPNELEIHEATTIAHTRLVRALLLQSQANYRGI